MVRIPVGSELKFLYNETCICHTVDEGTKVEYEGITYSISRLARKLLVEKRGWKDGTQAQGPLYFTYQGSTLDELRNALEDDDE